jgi:hypothetical protein
VFAPRDFDHPRFAIHLTKPDIVLVSVSVWRSMNHFITSHQDPDACPACRLNCARASCGLSREGFRSGSNLRKGRLSLGLGHKGSGLFLEALAGLSVGVTENLMRESASPGQKPQGIFAKPSEPLA